MKRQLFCYIIVTFIFIMSFSMTVFAEEGEEDYVEDYTSDSYDDSGLQDDFNSSDDSFSTDIPDDTSNPVSNVGSASSELGEFNSGDSSVQDKFNELMDNYLSIMDSLNDDVEEEGVVDEGTLIGDTSVSDSDVLFDYLPNLISDGIELYSSHDTYYGTIGTQYIEYARGFLPKLGYDEHYVLARTGQYTYTFAWGKELQYDSNGRYFSGSTVNYVNWYTNNNGQYQWGTESGFRLNVGNNMVYTDLGKDFPSLADLGDISIRQLLYLITIACIVCTCNFMYNVKAVRQVRKQNKG